MILRKAEFKIYQPTNPLEKKVQENFHEISNDWLDEKTCKLIVSSIASLKSFDDWLEKDNLLKTRMSYFFVSEMTSEKGTMVFLTHPLFVRDILENREIHTTLFNPISFVTTPIADFLFHDYPVHIYVNMDSVKRENRDKLFVDVGGLIICEKNVNLPQGCVEKIKVVHEDPETAKSMYQTILNIQGDTDTLTRYAAKMIATGVFQLEETERNLHPDMKVWDKRERKPGTIEYVDKGERGDVVIEYEEGVQRKIPKSLFDNKFIVTSAIHDGIDLETAIKQKILGSKVLMNIFKDFDVSPDELKNLKIEVADLDNRYAETSLEVMRLDRSLFEKGDFFRDNFFVICHELVHFLSRAAEKQNFFRDPEEILSFCSSVAFELEQGRSIENIWARVYPKAEFHFNDKNKARQFFNRIIEKARKFL